MGFLKWFESGTSDVERFAPLILVPVKLERQSVGAKFKLAATEEDIVTNLSLQAKLNQEFGVRLPDLPDGDGLNVADYLSSVRSAIASQPRWEVQPDRILLGFFSFAKFLMYRNLDPETWIAERRIDSHPLIERMLGPGFDPDSPMCGDDDMIDPLIPPERLLHVMDADSSQTLAIEEVRQGRHLVIQGPPGTGKSQTIANVIAAAVNDGKKVLFVAEKQAALDVVYKRLANVGLADMCLELHSHKASKRAVIEDLAKTLDLGRPAKKNLEQLITKLANIRDRLNGHADLLHRQLDSTCISPFRAIGELIKFRNRAVPLTRFELRHVADWSESQLNDNLATLRDFNAHLEAIGKPDRHPWRGVQVEAMLPNDALRLAERLTPVISQLELVTELSANLSRELNVSLGSTAQDTMSLAKLAHRLASAPPLDRAAIANPAWSGKRGEITALIARGREFERLRAQLQGKVIDKAWSMDLASVRAALARHGTRWYRWLNS